MNLGVLDTKLGVTNTPLNVLLTLQPLDLTGQVLHSQSRHALLCDIVFRPLPVDNPLLIVTISVHSRPDQTGGPGVVWVDN